MSRRGKHLIEDPSELIGQRVAVARDLRLGTWTIYTPDGRKAIAKVAALTLTECTFKASAKTAARIRKNNRRTIAAFAIGTLKSLKASPPAKLPQLRYNPHRGDNFTADDAPIDSAARLLFGKNGRVGVVA
jgi:hypothetical protein